MFEPCETFDEKGYYIAARPDEMAKKLKIYTSYQLVAARLLGFSYSDYLRYARSKGAVIKGRMGFSLVVFPKLLDCKDFCKQLNTAWKEFCDALNDKGDYERS